MIISILLKLVIFYFFLSVVYSFLYLPENISFQLRHTQQKLKFRTTHKIITISKVFFVSMIFGGISLAQKIYAWIYKKYKEFKAWYALAQFAKKMTKNIKDAIVKEKKS